MSFLSPLQLAWAVTVVLVVLLYVRWGLRSKHSSATLSIWRHALAKRPWWSRWRRSVSMLAACVPLLLIALALARPQLTPLARADRDTVLVIDNSASMNAGGGTQSSLADAKRAARRMIRNLRTHDRMAILSADTAVHIRCGITHDKTQLHQALDAVQPTDGAGTLDDAIATARNMTVLLKNPTIVVFSDDVRPARQPFTNAEHTNAEHTNAEHTNADHGDADRTPAERQRTKLAADASLEGIIWHRVGNGSANLGITRLSARSSLADPSKHEVLVEVSNMGVEAVQAQLELSGPESQSQTVDLQLPAGASKRHIATVEVRSPGLLRAELKVEDALAADNQASLLVAPQPKTNVLLVSGEADSHVEMALRSLPEVQLTVLDALPEKYPDDSLIVFAGLVPATVPAGPSLVIGPSQASDLWQWNGEKAANPVPAQHAGHRLLQGVDFRNVTIDWLPRLDFPSPAVHLTKTVSGNPLYVRVPRATGDVLVLAISSGNSDIAYRAEFPQLLANAIRWLQEEQSMTNVSWTTREAIEFSGSDQPQRLISPTGEDFSIAASHAVTLNQAGLWRQQDNTGEQNNTGKVVAVWPTNLVDAVESDLRRPDEARAVQLSQAARWPDIGPLWSLLVALTLVWVIGLWVLVQRRILE